MKTPHWKHKGNKIHPAPSSKPDSLSVLNLVPATILALASLLSLQDLEVLAYMVTRSLKTKNPLFLIEEDNKRFNYHPINGNFDCGCFDCYVNYWFKWNSSPDKDIICRVIDTFEEHLQHLEILNKKFTPKKQEKMPESKPAKMTESFSVPENNEVWLCLTDETEGGGGRVEEEYSNVEDEITENVTPSKVVDVQIPACGDKGFARKVLPDVSDLFHSRLWGLWGLAAH
ncbi:hypothetical protein ACHQM5_008075 [Ranunculus cassubicifolius]